MFENQNRETETSLSYISKGMFDEGNAKSAVILAIFEFSREQLPEDNLHAINKAVKMSDIVLESYENKQKLTSASKFALDDGPSQPKSLYPEQDGNLTVLPLLLNSIMKKVN